MIRARDRVWAERWNETPAHIARTWLPIRAIELRILAESYDFRHAARGSEDGGEDTDREGKGDVRVDDIRGFRCGFRCAQPTLRVLTDHAKVAPRDAAVAYPAPITNLGRTSWRER